MNKFSLEGLRNEIVDYLGQQPSTIAGWSFLFIAIADLCANLSDKGFVSMRIFSWFQSWFGFEYVGLLWTVLIIQVVLISFGVAQIFQSSWRVHLKFALRESNVWNLIVDGGRNIEGYSLQPKERTIMMVIEVVTAMVALSFFWPHRDTSTAVLGHTFSLVGTCLLIISSVWVFSSITRKIFDDRPTGLGLLLMGVFFVISQLIKTPGFEIVSSSLFLSNMELATFYVWQLLLLFAITAGLACFAITEFSESSSPTVSLKDSVDTIHRFEESLEKIPSRSLRVSLEPGGNQKVLVLSAPWKAKDSEQVVTVHKYRKDLPIVSRQFWFWNLSELQQQLAEPVDFERPTSNDMYLVKADFSAVPKLEYLDTAPMFLHRVAISSTETKLLDPSHLKANIGDFLMNEVEALIREQLQFAFESDLSMADIDSAMSRIETELVNELNKVRPSFRGHLNSFSASEQKARLDQVTIIATQVEDRIRDIGEMFEMTSVKRSVANFTNQSQAVLREIVGFGARTSTHWKSVQPSDEDFFEASCDFILDVLNIEIRAVNFELSERMKTLQVKYDTLKEFITSQFQAFWDESSANERAAIESIIARIPNGVAAKTMRTIQAGDDDKSAVRSNASSISQQAPPPPLNASQGEHVEEASSVPQGVPSQEQEPAADSSQQRNHAAPKSDPTFIDDDDY